MKITVEYLDEKVSIEREDNDINFSEFMGLIKRVAHGVGYSNETIDKWFNQKKMGAHQ